jgi:hypothetical protein
MRFYGHSDTGEVELPVSDEVLDLSAPFLTDWALSMIRSAVKLHDLNPALPLGVAGGSLTGELSDAWTLVNTALRTAARTVAEEQAA